MVLSHQVRNGGNIQNFESINNSSKQDVPSAGVLSFVFSSYFTIPGHTPKNNPWLPATTSHMKWGTTHRSRSFIEGKTTSRNDSTMTGQEDETPGIEGDEEKEEDGFNDPRKGDE